MNPVKPGRYAKWSLSCLFVVFILGGSASSSTAWGGEDFERCLLVSREGDVIHATSAKTRETLFKNADAKKVIQWALENGTITILEPGTYTVNEAVRVSRSGTSLIIKENATLQMTPGFTSSYISEEGADYYPLVYVAPKDVFSKDCILENVNVINFGTLKACGKTNKKATGRWGGGGCIIYDGRKWGKTCGIIGGRIFSSGVMTGCRGAALWILDCKKTEIPLMCAEHYGNGVVAAEGCEDLDIGILAGLAGEKAEENETIDLNYFNKNIRIATVIGSAPSEEILDINNSPNVTVERVVGYGDPKKMNLVGLTTYPRSSCMTLKKYIGNSASSVVVKRKDVVNKEVKQWERTVEVPPLPESLPRFAVKAKLIAVFEDGSREVVFDETIPLNLGGGE